jgi:hypothetical protein
MSTKSMIVLSVALGAAGLLAAVLYYKSRKKQKPKVPETKVLTAEEAQALFEKYFTLRES